MPTLVIRPGQGVWNKMLAALARSFRLALLISGLFPAVQAEGLVPLLTDAQIAETRKILSDFKSDPRGPFFRIRWFCNDGTVHPPSPPPCRDRGGGRQHATLKPEALKLAEWNIDVGTILAGMTYEELADAPRDHHRLKELVLEEYLEQVDNGWIYRRAYSYRGARQIEDEERAGRKLLVRLFSDPDWLRKRYFLANRLVEVVPHGTPSGLVRQIRTLAETAAEEDPRFQDIRAKIHSDPGEEDLAAVENFVAEKNTPDAAKTVLTELIELLKKQQSQQRLEAQLQTVERRLDGTPLETAANNFTAAAREGDSGAVFRTGAELSFQIFRTAGRSNDGARNLELLDLNVVIQEAGFRAAANLESSTRRTRIEHLADGFRYAVGAGLLSQRQLEALAEEAARLLAAESVDPSAYHASVKYLARAAEWCRATAYKEFGPLAELYQAVEPPAATFVDHVLRSSVALPLSGQLQALVDDANRAVGLRHSVLGGTSSAGVVGLNPGVAIGRLLIIEPATRRAPNIDPLGIYVIPQTFSDLKPMAGVLTLDSGNALSHTQLLAASLGIPNATVPASLLPQLRKWEGKEIFFAVTPRGAVLLRAKGDLSPGALSLWAETLAVERTTLDTDKVDLTTRKLLPLRELSGADSGVRVGPKAANLGDLASRFPTMVAQGFVIPFGVYAEHIRMPLDAGEITIETKIAEAFQRAEKLRAAGSEARTIDEWIYPRLAEIRELIETITFQPWFEKALVEQIEKDFGGRPQPAGVFVRSDTNAEDLPGFSGAGLNLTVPNQVGIPTIRQAIKDVWASPFTERAYDWRNRVFRGSHRIYPSVIVMRSVPSDKSGVIATVNLETGDTSEITVNASEGVSAVVAGGIAESLLLRPNGEVKLLHQARATYRKVLRASGGLDNLPPIGEDYLLTGDEIQQIRDVVRELQQKYSPERTEEGEPLPWDIEFGFEDGQLRLFQIRPLIRYREIKTLEALSNFDARAEAGPVRLDDSL